MRTALRSRSRRFVLATITLAAACSASPALAATGTFSDGGGSVTISDTTPVPGDTLTITGTGFDDATGLGSVGVPLVAVKPDAVDDPYGVWTPGGPDVFSPTQETTAKEAKVWFRTGDAGTARAGTFMGTIRIPATIPKAGPGSGADAGKHWLQVLSGAPFTSTGYPNPAAALTQAISIEAFFRVVDRVELGVTTDRFYPGTTLRTSPAPTQLTARGRGFTPDAEITVTRAGAPVQVVTVPASATPVRTTSTGALPDGLRLNLGANLTPGDQPLVISTGSGAGAVSETHTLKVLPAATGSIDTPRLRPGGLLSYRFSGFVGIGGAGQKVAVALNSDTTPIACVQADATGSGAGVVRLPTATPATATGPTPPAVGADTTVRFLSGTSCVGPTGPVNDAPGGMVPATLAVSDTAPTAAAPADVTAGTSFAVSGAGFGPGERISVSLDGGASVGAVTATGDGSFSGALTLPAETTPGARVLRFASSSSTAVAQLTAAAAPVVETPPATPGTPETPAAPGTPASPAAPATPATPVAPATPTTPRPATPKPANATIKSLRVKGSKVRVNVGSILGRRTTVSVKSAKKVRVTARSRAKVVTFAATTTTKAGVLSIALRRDGLAALKRLERVTVVVRLAPDGGTVVTKRLVLRR